MFSTIFKTFFYFLFLGLALRAGLIYLTDLGTWSDWKAFFYGLHFDAAVAGFFTFIWYLRPLFGPLKRKKNRRWILLLTFAYTVLFGADYLYIRESGRHMSYEVLNLLSIQSSFWSLIQDNWKSIIVSFFISLFFTYSRSYEDIPRFGIFKRSLGLLLVLVLAFVGVRGVYTIPMDPSFSFRAGGAKEANISLNSAYSILYAATSGRHTDPEQIPAPNFNTAEVFKVWRAQRGIHKPAQDLKTNVIFIFLESWSTAFEWPHFEEFQKKGLSVELMLAGGHRTTEGLFATMCSFPNPLGKGIMFTQLENFQYRCLPELLKEKGYHTAFFQGSDQLTSGVGPLAQKLGFKQSYGKIEYKNIDKAQTNSWGLYDTDLYDWVMDYSHMVQEPFFIAVNTNTTHDFKLPPNVAWKFGDSNDLEKSHSVMAYADEELGAFLQKLETQKYDYPLTVVLVADHTAFTSGGYLNHYSIPFALYYPGVKPQKVPGAFSQRDISATLADVMGVEAPHFLGRSMVRPQDFSDGTEIYHLGHSVWFVGGTAIDFNVRSPENYKCYDWRKDWNLTSEVTCPQGSELNYHQALSYLMESQRILFSGMTAKHE